MRLERALVPAIEERREALLAPAAQPDEDVLLFDCIESLANSQLHLVRPVVTGVVALA